MMGNLARQEDLGGFVDTVDPDLAQYPPDYNASNYSIQSPYARQQALPDARWAIGALAAQDAYNPDEGGANAALWQDPNEVAAARLRAPYVNPPRRVGDDPFTRTGESIIDSIAAPGRVMQPNPYPEGSELADWYDRQRMGGEDWARSMALNMMSGGVGGTGAKAGETALGSGPIRKAPALPMDEASRLARAAEQKYTIDAYHGTRSPNEIRQFETGHIYNDEGDLVHAYSGDPNSLIGPHAAAEPAVADKFAGGEGVDWLKNRHTEGNPAVYPLKLDATKVQKFKREEDLNTLLFRQDVGHMDEVDNILLGHGDDAGTRYVRDKNYREQVNREAVRNENNYDDPSSEVGHALADAVRRQYEKAGVTTIQYPNAVEGGTSYIAVAPPRSRFAAFDPANKDSGFLLGSGATDQKGAAAIQGIHAYHSSPHDITPAPGYPLGKFDLSKIGTGEGAQAYGHGLYFAENPAVSGQGGQYWNQFLTRFGESPERHAAETLKREGFDRQKAIDYSEWNTNDLRKYVDEMSKQDNPYSIQQHLDHQKKLLAQREAELELLHSGKPVGPRTYEVNINADPAHMLDWDKQFTAPQLEQFASKFDATSPTTRNMLEEWSYQNQKRGFPMPAGEDIVRELKGVGTNAKNFSRTLNEAGIPGIKYLDEGSRANQGNIAQIRSFFDNPRMTDAKRRESEAAIAALPQPTSNYVIFDPAKIDILKKYGIAGAAPVGLGALAAQGNYQQGD